MAILMRMKVRKTYEMLNTRIANIYQRKWTKGATESDTPWEIGLKLSMLQLSS